MATIESRKSRDGSVTYRARVRVFGHHPLTSTFKRKTDAKTWAAQIESDLKRGRQAPLAEAMRRTLAEAIDKFTTETLPLRPNNKTAKNTKAYLAWWKAELGGYSLANVTPSRIADARGKLLKTPGRYDRSRGNASVNRYLAALSTCLATAMHEYGWLEVNPCRSVKKLREPTGRVRFLSDEERGYLLAACKPNADLYAIVLLALSTGARQGEVLNLRWGDVDLQRRVCVLRETKNKDTRALPLAGPALAALKARDKVRRIDDDRVFPHLSKPDRRLDISAGWYAALEAAQEKYQQDCAKARRKPEADFLKNFRFHDLRHSAASYLAMNGASLAEISAILGHRTLQMVKRYAHLSEQHVSKVVERMNRAVFGEGE
jgi:integrase